MARLDNQITKIAFKVTEDEIALFINCNLNETVPVVRKPLRFDSASTLYIAQAGHVIDEAYEVSYVYFIFLLALFLFIIIIIIMKANRYRIKKKEMTIPRPLKRVICGG